MKLNIILFLISCIQYSIILKSESYSSNYRMLQLRNTFIRLAISNDTLRFKHYCNKLYNKGLTLYYKANEYYYNLSDEEKMLVDSVFALCY
jgi:hypothetical protein